MTSPESNFGVEYGEAYARVETDDGRILRVETDGNGGLIEFDEGVAPSSRYALPLQQIRAGRTIIQKIEADASLQMRAQDRHKVVWAAMQEVGSSTNQDLSTRLGLRCSRVTSSLQVLKARGLVTVEPSHPKGGKRVFIWSLVDTSPRYG